MMKNVLTLLATALYYEEIPLVVADWRPAKPILSTRKHFQSIGFCFSPYMSCVCGSDSMYQAILQKDVLPREDSDAPIESFWEAVLVNIRPFLFRKPALPQQNRY